MVQGATDEPSVYDWGSGGAFLLFTQLEGNMKAKDGVKRIHRFEMRLRPHERELIEKAAWADRERFVTWARAAVVAAAKRRLSEERR
jgi:hypothetical protein